MAISLNGTSQYVTLGTGVNIANARPFTAVALIDSANWRTSGTYGCVLSQGRTWYGSGSGGWTILVEAAANPRIEIGINITGGGFTSFATTGTMTPNTGLYLVGFSFYDDGANGRCRVFFYRYNTGALTVEASVSFSDANVGNSAAGDPFLIGVGWTGSAAEDFYPGDILWAAAFDGDLVGSGTTMAACPWISALVFQGPWGLMDRCRWLHAYSQSHAIDLSAAATRRNGTLQGAPSYSYANSTVRTGLPPGGALLVIRPQASGGATKSIPPSLIIPRWHRIARRVYR